MDLVSYQTAHTETQDEPFFFYLIDEWELVEGNAIAVFSHNLGKYMIDSDSSQIKVGPVITHTHTYCTQDTAGTYWLSL